MTVAFKIAFGFALVRGFQLAILTVPWLVQKVRRAEATENERSLTWMAGSRSVLLGLAIAALALAGKWETLGGLLLGDALLQLFDAAHAVALRKAKLAILPAVLGVLDVVAGIVILG